MSRIGKKPISIPGGVTATLEGQRVEVKGPKGVLSFMATEDVDMTLEDGMFKVAPRGDSKRARQQWGMSRSMVENCVLGVTQGFKKELEISGVGYRAQVQGKNLKLSLGYSHDVEYAIPEGISITCPKPTEIVVEGIDKQLVGEVAANIRKWRPPEPFKGKGVKYKDEYIFRKDGKKK
ncbi:MAG: 50S ribosomal protein L6 [Pseudomonadota bacterium]